MTTVQHARAYAIAAHKDTKYGQLPYEYHLQAVADAMVPCTEEGQMAAWLHDVVEDTSVTLDNIRNFFGGRVARLVDCVTDVDGKTREEKKAGMYLKLASGPPLARRLKLADRLANMTASMENPKMRKKYADEFPHFIDIAGVDSVNDGLIVKCYRLYMLAVKQEEIVIGEGPGACGFIWSGDRWVRPFSKEEILPDRKPEWNKYIPKKVT